MLGADRILELENKFMDTTRRFPPGRDIPAAIGDTGCRASSLEFWRWVADYHESEIKRLQAIVEKLPKTMDGVPVVPRMVMYRQNADGRMSQLTAAFRDPGLYRRYYSSREAVKTKEG